MNLVRMNLTESLKEYDKACAQHHAAASRVKRKLGGLVASSERVDSWKISITKPGPTAALDVSKH